ncbi:histidine kinase [uncultured Georgenia sp.]|uniref:sensor histidine kinase n=1 Tax=uncultured Georgenia sp. TaxID=378209 RepID=UPI0026132A1A|nr:histidine kinase [uncultured Georgenia sp.]HLV05818.1 histidine kinase [Actinomycetaceae bacterium]
MRTDRGWKRFYATGWLVSVLIGAAAVHQWQGRVRAVEERLAEAERTREAVVQRVAADERLRIARELHDSLSHSISVIKVQAGVAVHLARKRGQEVPEALAAIQEAAGDAAAELRETLRVLRRADERGEPVRGVDQLPELVRRAHATGLDTRLEVTGRARDLPPAVDAAAYRIVQEALTNVTRHARASTARVQVDYRPGWVVVRVDDDGVGLAGAPAHTGLGLVGMRERTAALGGHLVADGRPGGGFAVRAELPTGEAG